MRFWYWSILLLGVTLAGVEAAAQGATSAAGAASSAGTAPTIRNVQGKVVNGRDGSPVPRVLVNLNTRAVLTDAQGRFSFPEFSDTQAYVTLTKPGYSQSDRGTSVMMGRQPQRVTNLDAPLELKIYPDALILGTVTGRDGLPLSQVQVQLRRANTSALGTQAMMMAVAMTNSRGEYRFRQPPGRYQVTVQFVARTRETGETVIPETFPQSSGGDAPAFFAVASGEEKHVDLRPRTGPGFPVEVRVDVPEAQRGVQFMAQTASGEVFNVGFAGQSSPGTYRITLPAGNYLLRARLMSQDGAQANGLAKVTVTGRASDPVVLHMEPATAIPVELAIDSASASASNFAAPSSTSTGGRASLVTQPTGPPDLRQFNLRLLSLGAENPNGMEEQAQLRQKDDKTYEFRVTPGRYRLEANNGGRWYIESASYGVTNLMSSDINIASGASSAAIRLVVNDAKGNVTATVPIPPDEQNLWVYLIPHGPTLSPITPLIVFNNGTGVGTTGMNLPVGSYTALAVDHQVEEDVRNPEVLARFSATKQVDITASATATVALEVAKEKETPP